mmetsp:Transcript_85656/g.276483  ORF Transcript_85656/g.276483 Transcript_85656/m.276483 type:complete len:262 (+) Transcript_85656:438-1223(+)
MCSGRLCSPVLIQHHARQAWPVLQDEGEEQPSPPGNVANRGVLERRRPVPEYGHRLSERERRHRRVKLPVLLGSPRDPLEEGRAVRAVPADAALRPTLDAGAAQSLRSILHHHHDIVVQAAWQVLPQQVPGNLQAKSSRGDLVAVRRSVACHGRRRLHAGIAQETQRGPGVHVAAEGLGLQIPEPPRHLGTAQLATRLEERVSHAEGCEGVCHLRLPVLGGNIQDKRVRRCRPPFDQIQKLQAVPQKLIGWPTHQQWQWTV